jgi:SAM-dependent methyltransferase
MLIYEFLSNAYINLEKFMKLLNIGCGNTYHNSWVNIDVFPSSHEVLPCDLRRGLSFPDSYFDVVYHSHVLEHLSQTEAKHLINECQRVLKPNGILRVVVPDLEGIVRNYIDILEKVESGIKEAEANYDWMMLELYDQTTRTARGGNMVSYLISPDLKNQDFIRSRVGRDVEILWNQNEKTYKQILWKKLKSQPIGWFIQQLRNMVASVFVTLIAGNNARLAFQEGLFRRSGEIHHWMYDRFSLGRMLEEGGFVDVKVCRADESRIPEFNSYELDMVEGQVRKPDSLFMEGLKL